MKTSTTSQFFGFPISSGQLFKRGTAQALMAALSLGVIGGAILMVGPQGAWALGVSGPADAPPLPPINPYNTTINSTAEEFVITYCGNQWTYTVKCSKMECGSEVLLSSIYADPEKHCTITVKRTSQPLSYVDNQTLNYVHWGHDYIPASAAASGCSSCGGGSAPAVGVPAMGLLRKHRFRNEVEGGSFGVGGFSAYTDKRVTFTEDGGGIRAVAFDPNLDGPVKLVDGLDGDASDGVFHDVVGKRVKEARLVDANGALTSSLASARWFDLISRNGQVARFEVVTTASETSSAATPEDDFLRARWPLDEGTGTTVADVSDYAALAGHGGAFPVSPSFVSGKSGQAGDTALSFNGTNQSVVIGNPADLNFTGKITMSAWIKPSDTTGLRSILSHGHTNNPTAQTSMEISNGNLLVGAWPGTRPTAVPLPSDASTRFVHVVATYDGVNWNVYIDGVKQATVADAMGARVVNADWVIGASAMAGDKRFFQGAIDDVRIYNSALTDAEVSGLTAGTEPAATGLKAQWAMNEGSGATVADATGAATHAGTLAPSHPTWVTGRTGLPGDKALHFDGNGFVMLGNPGDLNLSGKITMTAWVKAETADLDRSVLAHGLATSPNAYDYLLLTGNKARGGSWDGDIYDAGATPPAGAINGNEWMHMAAEYDGKSWRMYVNGMLASATSASKGAVQVNANWVIGGSAQDQAPRCFKGSIDDVRIYSRALSDAEIYALGASQNAYAGRLVSIKDIKGYGLNVTYKYNPTANAQDAADVLIDPALLFQMNTSVDGQGHAITYTYGSQQIAGGYVISKADFGNNQSATYVYGDGLHLTQVNHANGSQSTFAYSVDPTTQKTTVAINDATAETGHEKKTAHLSNQITVMNATTESAQVWNQSALLARTIKNGGGEIAYMSFTDLITGGGNNQTTIYEGGNRVKMMSSEVGEQFYKSGAKLVLSSGWPTIQGTRESSYASMPNWSTTDRQQGTFPDSYQADGTYNTYVYDADAYPIQKGYADGTTERWVYDANHNITLHVDRAGRPTASTYDAQNNVLIRQDGGSVNLSTMVFTANADTGTTTYAYYPAGDPNQFLLQTETDANGNATDYAYDTNHRLISKTLPADVAGGTRPVYAYEYDSVGRLSKGTDPVGRYVQYTYDKQDRITEKNYCGISTEKTVYGTGDNANRVIAQSDRDGVWTAYRYDAAGRTVKTIGGIATEAEAVDPGFNPNPAFHAVTENTYLLGCSLPFNSTRNGEKTSYEYDYRNRLIAQTVYSGTGASSAPQGQRTTTTYLDNKVFKTTDAFGRNTYYAYRASDSQRVRTVREAIAGSVKVNNVAPTTFAQITALTRSTVANAPYVIEDAELDPSGLQLAVVDARGFRSETVYDSRGRATLQKAAVGTPVQAQAETIYDANNNVIEQRSPRYFDAADAGGVNKAKTVMTYSGRNLLLARTEAPGTAEEGTTTQTYYLDGKQATTTLPKGNVTGASQAEKDAQTTIQMNRPLCGWALGSIDQAGHGTLTNTTLGGDAIHTIMVKDLKSLTMTDAHGLVVPNFLNEDNMDVPDANTITESTTKYDSRHRPIASTVWSGPLGTVARADVPIYFGANSDTSLNVRGGSDAQNAVPLGVTGQTTLMYYSEDLTTATLTHPFGPALNIQPVLQKLIAANQSPLLVNGSNASARATLAPNGEVTVQIMDGMGRAVISAKLDTTAP